MTNTLISHQHISDSTSSTKSKSSSLSLTNNDHDNDNSFIKLCLNKPKIWNWELTTSQSSPNICFPKIQLYNKKGELLAETDRPNCVLRNDDADRLSAERSNRNEQVEVAEEDQPLKIEHSRSKSLQDHQKQRRQQQQLYDFEKASVPNLNELSRTHSARLTKCEETNDFLNGFINQLQGNGIDCKVRRKRSNSMDKPILKVEIRDEKVDEEEEVEPQPIYVYSEKGLLVRDFNAKEFEDQRWKYQRSQTTQIDPLPATSLKERPRPTGGLAKSKSANDVPKTKKFRRKTSSNSSHHSRSILQRISETRSITSSSDEQDSLAGDKPRYVLRTSRAGTLMVLEDPASNEDRKRRRPKSCGRFNDPISELSPDEHVRNNVTSSGHCLTESHYVQDIANIEKLIKTLLSTNKQQKHQGKEQTMSLSDNNHPLHLHQYNIDDDDNRNKKDVYDGCDGNENKNFVNNLPRVVVQRHQQQQQQQQQQKHGNEENENEKEEVEEHKNSISSTIKNKLNENKFNCCFTSSIPTHSTNDANDEMNINDDNDNNAIEKPTTDNDRELKKCKMRIKKKKQLVAQQKTLSNNINENIENDDNNNNNNYYCNGLSSANDGKMKLRSDVVKTMSSDGNECDGIVDRNKSEIRMPEESGKVKVRRRLWNYRRSASADSSGDNMRCEDEVAEIRRSRSRRRRKERNACGLAESTDQGDQIVGIKKLTLPTIEQKPTHLINNASEEVIFKLVQAVQASLQQQQQNNNLTPKGPIELDFLKQQLQNNLNSNKFNQLHNKAHKQKFASPANLSSNLNKSVKEEVFEQQQHQQHRQKEKDINYNNNNNTCNVTNLNTSTSNHCQKNNKNNLYSSTSGNEIVNNNNNNNNNCNANEKSNSAKHQEIVEAAEVEAGSNLCLPYSNGGREINNMGSNVSRQQVKGLSGRRTQSSGDLYNGGSLEAEPIQPKSTNGNNVNNNTSRQSKVAPSPKLSFADNIFRRSKRSAANFKRGFGKNSDEDSNADTNSTISSGNNNSSSNTNNNLQQIGEGGGLGGVGGGGGYMVVSRKDRNKFCGSLPNNLDSDDVVDSVFPNYNPNVFNNFQLTTNNDPVDYVTVPNLDDITYQQLSSCNASVVSGGQESSNSSSNLGNSTFRINNNFITNRSGSNPERKREISFKLPLNRTNIDTGYDQGYGSERSPEDELPPPLPMMLLQTNVQQQQQQQTDIPMQQQLNYLEQYWNSEKPNLSEYDFITQDCIFFVNVKKGPRGLGLSVSGGSDTNSVFPGLIRIKRLFPHQAAWMTGRLLPGDIILSVNGVALTGLTNYEALETLRTTDNNVILVVCRPQDERYRKLSPPTEAPKPPQRTTNQYLQPPFLLEQLDPSHDNFSGEYEVILTKQQGSLGFTLRKEDESVLGHCIRALVREPATTDGRLKPGDKILAVNDVPISSMTHEQAVIFLRQSPEIVKIRFYRDEALTPVSQLADADASSTSSKVNKPLRPEARNLLTDIAHRKQTPCSNSTSSSLKSSSASPRKLRRGTRGSTNTDGTSIPSDTCDFNYSVTCDTTTHSDSDASTIISQANSVSVHPVSSSNSSTGHHCHHAYTVSEPKHSDGDDYYREDELQQIMDDEGSIYSERLAANRPTFLNLAGPCGSTPTSSSRPRFQFSIASANAYELNNLDNAILDAPAIYTLSGRPGGGGGGGGSGSDDPNLSHDDQNFISLPCETFLVACKTESDLDNNSSTSQTYVFNHKNPLYQSVNVPMNDEPNISSFTKKDGEDGGGGRMMTMGEISDGSGKKEGTKSLLKWKGVMFTPASTDGTVDDDNTYQLDESVSSEMSATPDDDLSNSTTTNCTNSTPNTVLDASSFTMDNDGNKIITVELNKGWNSRLGFSLQYDINSSRTIISVIYEDSVAAKDGRLQVNDELLMINDEPVENIPTSDIIDGLRIIRGSICLTVLRKN